MKKYKHILSKAVFLFCLCFIAKVVYSFTVNDGEHQNVIEHTTADKNKRKLIAYGDMNQWLVRIITESFIIGGNKRTLYEIAPADTVVGNVPYKSKGGSPWATSNVYATVSGVTKASVCITPELRSQNGDRKDYCARLETRMESCKVLGVVNINALASGTIFLGEMVEPIKSTKNPTSNLASGVPFTDRPEAVFLDYKLKIDPKAQRIKSTGLGSVEQVSGADSAQVIAYLQKRWEDQNGNLFATRVGTAMQYLGDNQPQWVNNYQISFLYGDIRSNPQYKWYMNLVPEGKLYARNSKGQMMPIKEVGWDKPDAKPTHLVLQVSSSHGEPYVGTEGNTIWVDNIGLLYN